MTILRVAHDTEVSGLSQSIRTELEKAGAVVVGAIGPGAIDRASRSIASANSMFGNRLLSSIVYDKVEGRDGIRTCLRFHVQDPLHATGTTANA